MRILSAFILLIGLITACQTTRQADPTTVETTGTIQYVDLEGGFYGIVTDDGQQFDPTNLDADFREDGLRVHFRGRILEDVATIRMWGTPIELEEVHPL